MTEKSLKEKTARGLLWGGASNGMIQILNAAFGVCLLQLLTPEDYGTVQVLTIFSSIATCLQESGFTTALANKKSPSHQDYNAVFWFNIFCGSILYLILFLCAPLIASFYNEPILTPLARFSFLSFLISSFGISQRAYLFSHLMVKETSVIAMVSLLVSGTAGVAMAFCGFAFWGLAAQGVLFVSMVVVMNWWYSPWRPTWNFNFRPIKEMFGFSSKILITSLFTQINKNVFSVLLGKFYSKPLTGQYGNAYKWNEMGSSTINGMVAGVAQPVLAQVRNEPDRYRHIFRKMLRFTSFISFPAMFGLALIAPEFILLVAGKKWIPSIDILQMLCIYGAFFPIVTLYSNLVISQGKSAITMFNTITSCIVIWGVLFFAHPYGIKTMLVFFVSINISWLLIWHYFAWRLIRLPLFDSLKDVLPFAGIAGFSMFIAWLATYRIEIALLALLLKIILAAMLYIGILYLNNAKVLRESIAFIRKKKMPHL